MARELVPTIVPVLSETVFSETVFSETVLSETVLSETVLVIDDRGSITPPVPSLCD